LYTRGDGSLQNIKVSTIETICSACCNVWAYGSRAYVSYIEGIPALFKGMVTYSALVDVGGCVNC